MVYNIPLMHFALSWSKDASIILSGYFGYLNYFGVPVSITMVRQKESDRVSKITFM